LIAIRDVSIMVVQGIEEVSVGIIGGRAARSAPSRQGSDREYHAAFWGEGQRRVSASAAAKRPSSSAIGVALLLGELLAIRCLFYAPTLAYLAHLRPQKLHEPLLSETFAHPLERTRLLARRLVFLAPPMLQGGQRTRYSSTVPRRASIHRVAKRGCVSGDSVSCSYDLIYIS
jgi:hypothetical protein